MSAEPVKQERPRVLREPTRPRPLNRDLKVEDLAADLYPTDHPIYRMFDVWCIAKGMGSLPADRITDATTRARIDMALIELFVWEMNHERAFALGKPYTVPLPNTFVLSGLSEWGY